MNVICPACAAANREDALYCKHCGGALAAVPSLASALAPAASAALACPECQAPFRAGAHFCGLCGYALAGASPAATPWPSCPAPLPEPAATAGTDGPVLAAVPGVIAAMPAEIPVVAVAPAVPVDSPVAPPWVIEIERPTPAAVAQPPVAEAAETAEVTAMTTAATETTAAAASAAIADAAAAPPSAPTGVSPTPSAPPVTPTALPDDAALTVEDLEETTTLRRPLGLYAGVGVAGVALAGVLAWWLLRDAPAAASAPAAAPAVAATVTPSARAPDEEIITESNEPRAADVAPEPAMAATPAATQLPESPALAASAPARPVPTRQRPAPGASNDPPWQHPGSRAPAPVGLSAPGGATAPAQPPVAAAPLPPPDPLAPLRADLRQCDGESNILGKGVCVVRARHRHCGNHWGQVPECPLSQRNHDPYNN